MAEADRNCIGIAFRLLMRAGIVRITNDCRKSEAGDSHGRLIANMNWSAHTLRKLF